MKYLHVGMVVILMVICFALGYGVRGWVDPYTAQSDLRVKLHTLKQERLEHAAKKMQRLDVDHVERDRLVAIFDSVFFSGQDSIPDR